MQSTMRVTFILPCRTVGAILEGDDCPSNFLLTAASHAHNARDPAIVTHQNRHRLAVRKPHARRAHTVQCRTMYLEGTIAAWLGAIRDAGASGATTADLAIRVCGGRQRAVRGLRRSPARARGGAATELLKLQHRGLVTSSGPMGAHRRWWLTAAGAAFLEDHVKPPPDAVIVRAR